MFGNIILQKDRISADTAKRYRAFYCGLCALLREKYGRSGQLLLNYDLCFLVLLLSALYEAEETETEHSCVMHPVKTHGEIRTRFTEYGADMTVLLAYYNALDDWEDDRSAKAKLLMRILDPAREKVEKSFPRQAEAVRTYMRKLKEMETKGEGGLEGAAVLTGEMLAEIFLPEEDAWGMLLQRLGFHLGKYIYLLDAYTDLPKDREKGHYNPLISLSEREDFEEKAEALLGSSAWRAADAYERLPILRDEEILQEILYRGIWTNYDACRKKREKRGENS